MYMYMHMSVSMSMSLSMSMSMFRDLESGLSKDLKDGERGLRRANAGGGSWRYWRSNPSLGENESTNLAACFPQNSWRRTASSGKAND